MKKIIRYLPYIAFAFLIAFLILYSQLTALAITDPSERSMRLLSPMGWTPETVTDMALDPAIAIGPNGIPHIVSGNVYAVRTGGVWNTQIYGANVTRAEIAVDRNNRPHIIYEDDISEKYAYWDGTTWQVQVIYNAATTTYSIAVDSQNRPHIIYDVDGMLTYTYWAGTSWVTRDVAPGRFGSLTLDSNNIPHIVFTVYTVDLRYAVWNGASWTIEVVDANPGHTIAAFVDWNRGRNISSIRTDNLNIPHIAYVRYGSDGSTYTPEIVYAHKVAGICSMMW